MRGSAAPSYGFATAVLCSPVGRVPAMLTPLLPHQKNADICKVLSDLHIISRFFFQVKGEHQAVFSHHALLLEGRYSLSAC